MLLSHRMYIDKAIMEHLSPDPLEDYEKALTRAIQTQNPDDWRIAQDYLDAYVYSEQRLTDAVNGLFALQPVLDLWRSGEAVSEGKTQLGWHMKLVNRKALSMLINLFQNSPLYYLAKEMRRKISADVGEDNAFIAARALDINKWEQKGTHGQINISSLELDQIPGLETIQEAELTYTQEFPKPQTIVTAFIERNPKGFDRRRECYTRYYYYDDHKRLVCIIECEKPYVERKDAIEGHIDSFTTSDFRIFLMLQGKLTCINNPSYSLMNLYNDADAIQYVHVTQGTNIEV